jgi:heptosyltransferase I
LADARRLQSYEAQRIAIVKPSALGDIVHALPILGALRAKWPGARISWIVNRSYQSLIDGHKYLDETIAFDRSAFKGGFRRAASALSSFSRELRKRRFDLTIDLQGLARSGLIALATGARRRVGLGTAREGAALAYTDIVATPNADAMHAIDRYWLLAEALGVGDVHKQFLVPIRDEARLWASERLGDLPRPILAMGVGARWLTKRWPAEHYATLAKMAIAKRGGSLVFVGAPDESEIAERTMALSGARSINFCGKTDLQQLAAILESADAMLANDTGPLHLAVALGRPCVAPYTCTKVVKHGPYLQLGGIETDVWCKGSYIKTCDRLECMTELQPERLWPALDRVL